MVATSVTTDAASIPRLDALDVVPKSNPLGVGGLTGGTTGLEVGSASSVAMALGTMEGMSLGTSDGISLGIKLEDGMGVGHAT